MLSSVRQLVPSADSLSAGTLPPAGHVAPFWLGPDGRVPYVLSPFQALEPVVAAAAVEVLDVGSADWFVDFGAGDGTVLAAAAAAGARVAGVDLDGPLLMAAASLAPAADFYHEPIGWTPPVGPTCGMFHLLPWAVDSALADIRPYLLSGFRLAVVDASLAGLSPAVDCFLAAPSGCRHALRVYVLGGGPS